MHINVRLLCNFESANRFFVRQCTVPISESVSFVVIASPLQLA